MQINILKSLFKCYFEIKIFIYNTMKSRGDNSCSLVGFVSCWLMIIRLYGSTLTQHVY